MVKTNIFLFQLTKVKSFQNQHLNRGKINKTIFKHLYIFFSSIYSLGCICNKIIIRMMMVFNDTVIKKIIAPYIVMIHRIQIIYVHLRSLHNKHVLPVRRTL